MKLDRNINPNGGGKYALVNRRKVRALGHPTEVLQALSVLERAGVLHNGDEGPGEQFFVMKYKDQFTSFGLEAYAKAVNRLAVETGNADLREYASEMFNEADTAHRLGTRIPD